MVDSKWYYTFFMTFKAETYNPHFPYALFTRDDFTEMLKAMISHFALLETI